MGAQCWVFEVCTASRKDSAGLYQRKLIGHRALVVAAGNRGEVCNSCFNVAPTFTGVVRGRCAYGLLGSTFRRQARFMTSIGHAAYQGSAHL
jgi:hypothetical protein